MNLFKTKILYLYGNNIRFFGFSEIDYIKKYSAHKSTYILGYENITKVIFLYMYFVRSTFRYT